MARSPRARRASPAEGDAWRARIRMYRQGLGDCFLVTLNAAPRPYHILIDCGVILGTPDAAQVMTAVAKNIAQVTEGRIDLLVATHEHYDHLSGFVLAKEELGALDYGEVWLGWTEDPDDPLARSLVKRRDEALAALRLGAARLALAGEHAEAADVDGLLGFFGVAGAGTKQALETVRRLTPAPRYVRPDDAPRDLPGGARLFVLGPPRDPALLKKSAPSAGQSYGLDALDRFAADAGQALAGEGGSPFGPAYAIPLEIAKAQRFFRETYLEPQEARRRLDDAWLGSLTDLALQLDSETNNTSVVLALELAGGDVLLFPADAQIGSWLSWPELSWGEGEAKVTGADLLARTILYKVGHHGSHNATLKPRGLELMGKLAFALLPVDQAMAVKKRWGRMPLPDILEELERRTAGRVVRIDRDLPTAAAGAVTAEPLFYELTL